MHVSLGAGACHQSLAALCLRNHCKSSTSRVQLNDTYNPTLAVQREACREALTAASETVNGLHADKRSVQQQMANVQQEHRTGSGRDLLEQAKSLQVKFACACALHNLLLCFEFQCCVESKSEQQQKQKSNGGEQLLI